MQAGNTKKSTTASGNLVLEDAFITVPPFASFFYDGTCYSANWVVVILFEWGNLNPQECVRTTKNKRNFG